MKWPELIIRNHMEPRLRFALLVVDQLLQVIVKRAVIDLLDHLLFLFRERRSEKAGVDQAEQLVLEFPVSGQLTLERPRDVRQIALAGVVKKARQHDPVRQFPGGRLPRAENGVLRDGPVF